MRNKTILITGASSGIGKALACLFAKHHYHLILVGRNEVALKSLSEVLSKEFSVESMFIIQDLKEPNAATTIKSILDEKNIKIDILVNNAGIGSVKHFFKLTTELLEDIIAVNITMLTKLTHVFMADMLERNEGHILNISSLSGLRAMPYFALYSATKAYVIAFSDALGEELRGTNVHITTLCPGVTDTPFLAKVNVTKENARLNLLPMMSAEKVAEIAFFAVQTHKRLVITGFMNKLFLFSLKILRQLGLLPLMTRFTLLKQKRNDF